jgi:hypothetical protein
MILKCTMNLLLYEKGFRSICPLLWMQQIFHKFYLNAYWMSLTGIQFLKYLVFNATQSQISARITQLIDNYKQLQATDEAQDAFTITQSYTQSKLKEKIWDIYRETLAKSFRS